MIPDKIFKNILHDCKGYAKFLNGGEIEPGYKPDYVLKKKNDFIILESENSSSRKTFVGGLIKAAHYLQGEKTGILIFVLVPKENTSVQAIANHLIQYLSWIQGKTNLREVYVLEAGHYFDGKLSLKIKEAKFKKHAIRVKIKGPLQNLQN